MLDFIRKKYANYVLKPWLTHYLQEPRIYRHDNLKLKIYPSVFHPKYFFSTLLLAEFIKTLTVNGKSFCEVGAGSGLISFIAFEKGAKVTALDLNETAVKGLLENLETNFIKRENFFAVQSDLFDAIPAQKFDIIFINPPYFFKEVSDNISLAWNCGENGEYFVKLFAHLNGFCNSQTGIYMILADNCDIERIRGIAAVSNFNMVLVLERKIKWEKNFIFKLNFGARADSDSNT
jgi:release factor glutamine methyltransferase